ncbi:hypothetical protein KY334_02290 [Candidatus Woesearchaeota archaeon]|nr:hypothetical protein [Candidatus Woesearchaeota archaeon]
MSLVRNLIYSASLCLLLNSCSSYKTIGYPNKIGNPNLIISEADGKEIYKVPYVEYKIHKKAIPLLKSSLHDLNVANCTSIEDLMKKTEDGDYISINHYEFGGLGLAKLADQNLDKTIDVAEAKKFQQNAIFAYQAFKGDILKRHFGFDIPKDQKSKKLYGKDSEL